MAGGGAFAALGRRASQGRRVLGDKVSQGRLRRGVAEALESWRNRAMNHGYAHGTYADKSYGMESPLAGTAALVSPVIGAGIGAEIGGEQGGESGETLGAALGLFGAPLAVMAAARTPGALRTVGGSALDGALEAAFGVAARKGRGFAEAKQFALERVRKNASAPGMDPAFVRDIEDAIIRARDIDDLHATLAMLKARDASPTISASLPAPRIVPGWHPTRGWVD